MKMMVEIIGHEMFETKRRELRHQLACLDIGKECRLLNTFDYSFSNADADKFGDPAMLVGKTLEVGISHIEPAFGGRLRMRGMIFGAPKAA